MSRGRAAVLAAAISLDVSCRKAEPPAPPSPPPVETKPVGRVAAADPAAQAELFAAVAEFTLTEKHVDAIAAVDAELKDLWANPAEVRRIRGQLSLPGVVREIEATPRFLDALARQGLSARDYTLGTFAMLGGYSYEMVKQKEPAKAEGKKPPVNEATLLVLHKRFVDIEKIVRPPKSR